jgi:hypothetical protein
VTAPSAAAAAEKQPVRVRLEVTGPADCANAASLGLSVDAILGRSAVVTAQAPASSTPPLPKIVVSAEQVSSARFKATLQLQTPDGKLVGTRDVVRSGASCDVLTGPLAIVTALLVDVAEDTIHLEIPPSPPVAPPVPPSTPPVALPPPTATLPPPTATLANEGSFQLRSEAGATLLLGLLPPAVGARLDTRLIPAHFAPLLLRLEAFPHATASAPRAGGEFLAFAGSAGVCPDNGGRVVRLDLCLGGMGGVVRAVGRDVPIVGQSTSFFAMLLGEAGAALRLAGPVSLRASAGVAWGARPHDWHVDAPREPAPVVVWQPWPVAVSASLGIVLDTSENRGTSRH